jgi:thiol-disulfide isomerase/thioredoxin
MNNRIYLLLIIGLSGLILLAGAGLIGAALYLQSAAPSAAAFPAPANSNELAAPAAPQGIRRGADAPDISVTTVTGELVRLSDFKGRPVMINFWASWCGPCTAEMKNIEAVYQDYKDEQQFVVLAVNQGESEDTVKGYAELWKLNFRLLMDKSDEAGRRYRIQALPTTIFVDHEGKIYEVEYGGPMSEEFIRERVEALIARMK